MAGVTIEIVPRREFDRVERAGLDRYDALPILADMHRLNALATVKRAGSGHLGSTFSSLDVVTWLYSVEMNVRQLGHTSPDRDVYLSSKGHDAPGLYAVLYGLGILPEEQFIRLRREGGTPGHPDVSIPGVEANTGSLGMGVSKGAGIALAKRLAGADGRVFVMTGDGEWQEGQVYEALMTASAHRLHALTVIVDHNTVQSDRLVAEICDLGDLEAKGRAFGWHVERCDGHEPIAIERALRHCRAVTDRPQLIVADTIKGRGVSFMEHPRALDEDGGSYRWPSGAPDDESFARACRELIERIDARLAARGVAAVERSPLSQDAVPDAGGATESIGRAYGEALLAMAPRAPAMIVLDADLALDCHVRPFERACPGRFIEIGIAEQDMVSTAGALARQGFLPVVNTFAAFLAARANEQIYNNVCEGARIVYAAHYAGLIPAGPGSSHQSVRDISLLGGLPDVVMLQPCCADEARMAVEYAVLRASVTCVLRMNIGPAPAIALPAGYRLEPGRGVTVAGDGHAPLKIIAYGPVMVRQALVARDHLAVVGHRCDVINLPWLNRVDDLWLQDLAATAVEIAVVEDHAPVGAVGDLLLRRLNELRLLHGRSVTVFGVDGLCACGSQEEALRHHGLDGVSLAGRIAAGLGRASV
jgi:transketolase